MKKLLPLSMLILAACGNHHTTDVAQSTVFDTPVDSIVLSDPFVLADSVSGLYYMTGTGGRMWKSKDLAMWAGAYDAVEIDTTSWMGPHPMIWAAELHPYNGKYYYFATFTNTADSIGEFRGARLDRRASHILVADTPDGPYRPISVKLILPADKLTLDGTFWVDTDGKPYMVYCWEWLQNWDGTIEKIELAPDLGSSVGNGEILFRASDSPWSREIVEGIEGPNRVTDGPFLFRTDTGRLGMLWTSWVYKDYTQGVAYSAGGTLDGPWIQSAEPITPPNYGHGMLFRTFDGRTLMSVHSHDDSSGHYVRRPHFFEVDLSGDSLVLSGH